MPMPPIPELEVAAKKIVWGAVKEGTLKEYTPRLIRQGIEKQFKLEEGSLDEPEYKSAIKAATKAAMDEEAPASDEEEKPTIKAKDSSKKKRKSDGTVKVEGKGKESVPIPKAKAKGKAKATPKDDDGDEGGSAKKKRKTVKAKNTESKNEEGSEDREKGNNQKAPPAPKSRPKLKDTKFKSAEHVPTSDMEQDDSHPVIIAESSTSGSKPDSPSRPKPASVPKSDVMPKKAIDVKKEMTHDAAEDTDVKMGDAAAKSESELSVLIDEPPKRKRKSKSGEKEPKKTAKSKEKKDSKSSTTLSKDEETIKRLKSLVVACGTRKVWSKVFQGLDTPQQQIKKLKEILAGLGMTGRLSLEQAKAIKEKRELAQELEDVQAFADKVAGRSSRSRSQATKNASKVEESESEKEDGSDSEEEDGAAPRKRPMTARKSILAFLEDQSDDE